MMNDAPILQEVAHRVMTHELGTRQTSDELSLAAVTAYVKLLVYLSTVLGKQASPALFRSSLRHVKSPLPFFANAKAMDQDDLLDTVRTYLQKQPPDVAAQASIALLTSFVELLATFIGRRLTWQFLCEVWPQVLNSPSQEMYE